MAEAAGLRDPADLLGLLAKASPKVRGRCGDSGRVLRHPTVLQAGFAGILFGERSQQVGRRRVSCTAWAPREAFQGRHILGKAR
ncbi:hypothetical protein ABZ801_29870 [Actinomadura sp. NPDC047616]|uniref:hypothetical protein n=1 Tax=Actinomadura sp. NPDC047616 TaxID=3155914 RepID=UPI0033C1691D